MAEKLTEESANREHNVAARKDQITKAFQRLYDLDRKIDALTEKHIQDLRDEKSNIKKNLRKDLNLTAKVVQLRYSSYKAERQAVENEDDITMDSIRELYELMPVGGMVDMIAVMQNGDTDEAQAAAAE